MSTSKALALIDLSSTGYVGDGKRGPLETPDTYFMTLYESVEAWYYHLAAKAAYKGYGKPETDLSDLQMEAMYEGQSQRFFIPLVDGKGKHGIYISIYKRDEGVRVYEATAYIS
jgi:hypothetical protein